MSAYRRWGVVEEPRGGFNPRHYIAQRAQGPLKLDGRLDKEFWEHAPGQDW